MTTTYTNKPVTRVSMHTYPSRLGVAGNAWGKPRKIVASFGPGDVVTLRYQGLRSREFVKLDTIMRFARYQRLLVEMTTKRAARKRKRR